MAQAIKCDRCGAFRLPVPREEPGVRVERLTGEWARPDGAGSWDTGVTYRKLDLCPLCEKALLVWLSEGCE